MSKTLSNFAIFIMVYGRPDKMWTLQSLRKAGYTGKVYFVASTDDSRLDGYRLEYGKDLLVFSKDDVASEMDPGDNSGDLRSTMFAANTIFSLAKDVGVEYFMIMCDDYLSFSYKFNTEYKFAQSPIRDLDSVLAAMLEYYKKTSFLTLAMGQGGDYIGGKNNQMGKMVRTRRKAMNSFICSVNRPFKFIGRLNEDVTTYVNLGGRGYIFLTLMQVALDQQPSQKIKGGLTEVS